MSLSVPSIRRAAACAALLLSGCASFVNPGALPVGSPIGDVTAKLGPATADYAQPDGARRLEYSGGTYGLRTWMLDFDATGALRAAAQVRKEASFNQILAGTGQDEVLRRLGHPSRIWPLPFQKQMVWSYRYETPFCQWFQIGMGYDGRVVDTGYAPDPGCDDDVLPQR